MSLMIRSYIHLTREVYVTRIGIVVILISVLYELLEYITKSSFIYD